MSGLRSPKRGSAQLAALTLAVFAVHAPPAGPSDVVVGETPLLRAEGLRVQLRLPGGFLADPGRAGVFVRRVTDGLVRCGTELQVTALASMRGVRFDPASSTLTFRLEGRRTLRVAARATRGERATWRGDAARVAVGAPPVEGVARFPGPGVQTTLVRVAVGAFADTTSPVQRTPAALGRCTRAARRVAPAALDTALLTAEVTSARRGAP